MDAVWVKEARDVTHKVLQGMQVLVLSLSRSSSL